MTRSMTNSIIARRGALRMKDHIDNKLDNVAKASGYTDQHAMLMDYGFVPTIFTPKHKKIEILLLLAKNLKKK